MTDYIQDALSRLDTEWRKVLGTVMEECCTHADRYRLPENKLNAAAFAVTRAVADCQALDEAEGGRYFEERLRASLSLPVAHIELLYFIIRKPDGRKASPMSSRQGAVITYIKERLRDGVPLPYALREMSEVIGGFAADGDSEFFFRLARAMDEMVKKPESFSTRSLKQWVERAWLPLALWMEWDKPQEAHSLLERAKACLPVTRDLKLPYPQFYGAWSKFKGDWNKMTKGLPDSL
jgi:hypothetical protein